MMQRYILVRFWQSFLALLLLSMVIFLLARSTGDPLHLLLPMQATPEDYANARRVLGLDKPLPYQYWVFISHAVRGDFGMSIRAHKPVAELLAERLPNSAKLAGFALLVSLLIAFPLGVVSAVYKGSRIDTVAKVIAVSGQSLPAFWVGIVLIEVVAGRWQLLPAGGTGGLAHYLLPGFTLGWFVVAGIMRLLRSSMLDVLDSEFVKMARLKGVQERWVIWKHALRNALIPVATFGAIYFAILVTTAIVVETVFAWPGMGRLTYEAITSRDFPVIQAVVLTTALIVIVVNLGVDILYAYLDPRIRYGTR
jgi:peptide/nickel transport system permease protein